MHKPIIVLTLAVAAMVGGAGNASAWDRKVTIDTNRGSLTRSVEVYCFQGACYRESELTGVNGNTLRRSGMCVRVAYEQWDCKGTVTGPAGNSHSRRFRVTAY
ncbi:hypothetical protein [Devosia sp. A16]|uniref:hypothetical protein n=1 Tax=Devosia sp. A16 TaxID=1736675 RepID=UPI0006D792FB|nr:hypothetical protein [Devosia sp. A16]